MQNLVNCIVYGSLRKSARNAMKSIKFYTIKLKKTFCVHYLIQEKINRQLKFNIQ